jgi:hypothetical protein
MNAEVAADAAIFRTILMFVVCGAVLYPAYCFFKKFRELLGRLDLRPHQQDEARVLNLISVSVEHGLRAIWISWLVIVGTFLLFLFGLSLYRYFHTVVRLF